MSHLNADMMLDERGRPPSTDVLGVPVSLVTIATATRVILGWKGQGVGRYVCVRDVHGVMLAQDDALFMQIHRDADMVTPDGMPLALIAKRRHPGMVSRTCGSDLFRSLLSEGVASETRHYFFGGKPGVAEALASKVRQDHPGLLVVGTGTPPFHVTTPEEDERLTRHIAEARPDILWIGLSTPKQERWMAAHRERLPGTTAIGVGAVFDFYIGSVRRAPRWMSDAGFEWLFRLLAEPRRLWRRYLVIAPRFIGKLISQKTAGNGR